LLLLLLFVPLHAQKVVTGNPGTFTAELRVLAEDLPLKEKQKEAEQRISDFELWWQQAPLDDSAGREAVMLVQRMWDRKLRLDPVILTYLDALEAFPFHILSTEEFRIWLSFSSDLLQGRKARNYTAFLDATAAFFNDFSIYQSRSLQWQLQDARDLRLEYDSTLILFVAGTDLKGRVKGDSTLIATTSGRWDIMNSRWIGEGGKLSWERVGLDPDMVYANLPSYALDLRSTSFIIDSAVFTHREYLERPLLGRLEEKLMMQADSATASYPRFSSYLAEMVLRDIFPGIDYSGGFSMEGKRVLGRAVGDRKAVLDFRRGGKLFIRLRAAAFAIHPDRISSQRASVAIYHEEDSIFHPGLRMRYLHADRELSLLRPDDGLGQSPYMDTWHGLDMYFEAMYWRMDGETINLQDIRGLSSEGRAFFESMDYYSRERYELLQGIDDYNPLDLINNYCKRNFTEEFYLEDYVNFIRRPPDQVKAVLLDMANRGFINYDLDNDRIRVKDRLFKYLRARAGRSDYDVMQLRSTISALPNATLSLANFDLKIRGVPAVFLSDSQQVIIYPTEQELVMQKNRSFRFNGKVQAGNFQFHTRESNFDYEKFRINMPVIDRMVFRVQSFQPDANGFYTLEPVQTVLSDLSGEIQIDMPHNKSGKDSNPEYPIFKAGSEAYAYYDDKRIHGGVYTRDRFNYRIRPFTIDSLDNLSTAGLEFDGYLNSGGIFPDLEVPLKVRPDYSLGFVTETPASGYPAYGGKGTYYNTIDLSNQGLRGTGSIEYLASLSESRDILFYLDSTRAGVDRFSLKEQRAGVQFPQVSGEALDMLWIPYQDVMHLRSTTVPALMYAGEARLKGRLALRPEGLSGAGELDFEDALMSSNHYSFLHHEFNADTSDFSLKSFDLSELAFVVKDYRAHVDLEKRKGEFRSNGGVARVEFLLNDYITFMDECTWLMDEAKISLRNTTAMAQDYGNLDPRQMVDARIIGSEFISVHPAQDSLRFFAGQGVFDLKEGVIRAEGVQFIRVADAAIFPHEKKVAIYRKAEMGTLENARVLADVKTKYHLLDEATVNVHSRNSYGGKAFYPYKDESGTLTRLPLHTIGAKDGISFAEADVSDSARVYLSPAFAYQGKARMDAPERFLNFDGAFRIAHDCDTLPRPWVKFEGRVNPDTVIIPLATPVRDISNRELEVGVMYSNGMQGHYAAFLQRKAVYSDESVVVSGGAIMYDKASQEYRIASVERLKDAEAHGSYLSLSRKDCSVLGTGPVYIGAEFGQVGAAGYGEVHHLMVPDSTWMRVSLSLNFFFSAKALETMANDLDGANLEAADFTEGFYPASLKELLGADKAEEVIAEISMYGSLQKVPEAMKQTLVLSDVTLAWNEEARAWVSQGDLGLASVAGKSLLRKIPGKLVVERKRSGDVLTLYLEAGSKDWYLFSYSRSLMQALAADNEFNTIIREEKPDDRTQDVKKGEQSYRYIISTERKRRDFIRKFMDLQPGTEGGED
jgi:hypothetical protein